MSILTELLRGKIKWPEAKAKADGWLAATTAKASPEVKAGLEELTADVKQAASDAIALASTAAAPIILVAGEAVEQAALAAMKAYLGPIAVPLTPMTSDAINRIEQALIQQVKEAGLRMRAELAAKV